MRHLDNSKVINNRANRGFEFIGFFDRKQRDYNKIESVLGETGKIFTQKNDKVLENISRTKNAIKSAQDIIEYNYSHPRVHFSDKELKSFRTILDNLADSIRQLKKSYTDLPQGKLAGNPKLDKLCDSILTTTENNAKESHLNLHWVLTSVKEFGQDSFWGSSREIRRNEIDERNILQHDTNPRGYSIIERELGDLGRNFIHKNEIALKNISLTNNAVVKAQKIIENNYNNPRVHFTEVQIQAYRRILTELNESLNELIQSKDVLPRFKLNENPDLRKLCDDIFKNSVNSARECDLNLNWLLNPVKEFWQGSSFRSGKEPSKNDFEQRLTRKQERNRSGEFFNK